MEFDINFKLYSRFSVFLPLGVSSLFKRVAFYLLGSFITFGLNFHCLDLAVENMKGYHLFPMFYLFYTSFKINK